MSDLMTGEQAVAWFRSYETHDWGTNVNYVNPFSTALGRPGEYYCADAVTDTLLTAGIDIRQACPGFCNVGAMFNFMWHAPATGHLGFKTIELGQELPGDVVMYFFGGRWGHVGMIRAPHSNGQFYTIEGDTSSAAYPGSDTTGGVTTDRDRRDVDWPNGSLHIFRPTGYATAPAPKPTPAPAPSVSLPTLQIGAKGAPVKALQAFLLSTFPSYAGPIKSSGGADGVFGSGTQRVVKEFQSRSRLTADGVVGPHTWQSLIGDGFKA